MAFDRNKLSGNLGAGSFAPLIMTYKDLDSTKAQIAASGYFNDYADDLTLGDFLLVAGSNGSAVLAFTSAVGVTPVTTEEATLA